MADTGSDNLKSAIGIIEETFHFLRLAPAQVLVAYYMGTLPFVLSLMYFWSDMSRNAFAASYCSVASLGMAVMFVWMKCWHSVFASLVYDITGNGKRRGYSVRSVLRMVYVQTVLQVSGLIILPLSLVATIPYPWMVAFYQNILVTDYSGPVTLRHVIRQTFDISKRQTLQNWKVISILSLFKLFVMLNVGIALYTVPILLKSLTGIESVFTMGGFSVMNSTFLLSVLCLTHLCVDPVVKTLYTLRFFYGESETTGTDLLSELIRISRRSASVLLVMVACCLVLSVPRTSVSAPLSGVQEPVYQDAPVRASELAESIDEVLKRKEFAWRMPREKSGEAQDTGFLGDLFDWLEPYLEKAWDTLESWIDAFIEWIESLGPEPGEIGEKKEGFGGLPRTLLLVLLGITVVVLVGFLVRMILSRRRKEVDVHEPETVVPDVSDESVLADDLPPDKWLELARDLMDKGEFRLAMRALYLGTLSRLAESRLITIAGYKSNREYYLELSRRFHEFKGISELFGETVRQFDRVWYGLHEVSRPDVEAFAEHQTKIKAGCT